MLVEHEFQSLGGSKREVASMLMGRLLASNEAKVGRHCGTGRD